MAENINHKGTLTLKTDRLALRPFKTSDVEEVYNIMVVISTLQSISHGFHVTLLKNVKIS